jgi:hypothetical protein
MYKGLFEKDRGPKKSTVKKAIFSRHDRYTKQTSLKECGRRGKCFCCFVFFFSSSATLADPIGITLLFGLFIISGVSYCVSKRKDLDTRDPNSSSSSLSLCILTALATCLDS